MKNNCLYGIVLGILILSGCGKDKGLKNDVQVWRASNDNGDKPGIGIELTRVGDRMFGRFFILDPGKPHDFEAGLAYAIHVKEQKNDKLICEVSLEAGHTDSFTLQLPKSFPKDQFVGVFQRSERKAPIEYKFTRIKK